MHKALVVGIDNYKNAQLRGCVNDANSIATLLRNNGDGSPNFSVKLLTSPSDSVTRPILRESIESLFSGNPAIALFYFSGHGIIPSYGGYIVTSDFERYDEGIPMDEILNIANGSKAKDKVIILDCCYSGRIGSPSSTSNLSQLTEGLTILTASRDTESAIEKNGKGVFTSLVLDALTGGAADLQGYITAGNIYSYVDKALGPWDQRPIFKTNVSNFASLRAVQSPIDLFILKKITDYFINPEDEVKLDPSFEFADPRKVEANVKILQNLQEMVKVGLVVPVGEKHMYFAAMNSKSCKLTAMGYKYWRLVKENRI